MVLAKQNRQLGCCARHKGMKSQLKGPVELICV